MDDSRYYYEQPHIIEQRKTYLRKMRQNRADKKPVVFLDETWANAHDGKDLAWVEDDAVTGGTLRDAHLVKVSALLFLEREVRWVGSPIPLSSSNPRKTQAITMMK